VLASEKEQIIIRLIGQIEQTVSGGGGQVGSADKDDDQHELKMLRRRGEERGEELAAARREFSMVKGELAQERTTRHSLTVQI
jgi:hypothetical protein